MEWVGCGVHKLGKRTDTHIEANVKIHRIDHVVIVVNDFSAAKEFFLDERRFICLDIFPETISVCLMMDSFSSGKFYFVSSSLKNWSS
jgi:hypothetical protein